MTRDLRVCFLGDSFVAGVGDPEHLGWVGRVAVRSHRAGQPLTAYNLGVRRQTSRDVLTRWSAECAQRLPADCDSRIAVSFGVNDVASVDGTTRVRPEDTVANLGTLLSDSAGAGWPALVVGPPPIADQRQNDRTAGVDESFARLCAERAVPYVSVFACLVRSDTWMQQVADGDGSHPAAAGYRELADLIWPRWRSWLA